MNGPDRLARSYQRLLRVYPAWYRRERGLEMLTTLLDDTEPGRLRPHRADVTAMIAGGLRARMRPPRRLIAWPINIMITFSIALAFASVTVLASGYPGPPTEDEAIGVATIAVGPVTRNIPGPAIRCPCGGRGGNDQVVRQDEEPMRIDYTMVYYPSWQQATTMWVSARERLVRAGFRVLPGHDAGGDVMYVASSDALDVYISVDQPGSDPNSQTARLTVAVSKRVPALFRYGVVVAGLTGLIVGWPTGVWALHRDHRHRLRRRRLIRAAAWPFFAIASLILMITSMFALTDFADGIDQADVQAPLVFTGIGGIATGLSILCAVLGLTAIVLAAVPSAARGTPTDGSPRQADQATT